MKKSDFEKRIHDIERRTSGNLMNWEISRACEICGRGTRDIDKHICDECRDRLRKILYQSQKGTE